MAIDLRKIEEDDPVLEDLATLHLDILASQKGYKRPIPTPWTPYKTKEYPLPSGHKR